MVLITISFSFAGESESAYIEFDGLIAIATLTQKPDKRKLNRGL